MLAFCAFYVVLVRFFAYMLPDVLSGVFICAFEHWRLCVGIEGSICSRDFICSYRLRNVVVFNLRRHLTMFSLIWYCSLRIQAIVLVPKQQHRVA